MEAYAGYSEQTDYEIGRLLAHLDEKGLLENTAVFVVLGDNGADIGGGPNGEIEHVFPKELTADDAEQMAHLLQNYDKIGTGEVMSSYPMGWSQAMNTPYRDWKTQAYAEGGTRTGMVVNWPKGITRKNEVRTQYTYLTDLLPTALEIADAKVAASATRGGRPASAIGPTSPTCSASIRARRLLRTTQARRSGSSTT